MNAANRFGVVLAVGYVAVAAEAEIRSIIKEIRLVPENGRLEIEITGELAAMLALATESKKSAIHRGPEQVTLVAGTRNHRHFLRRIDV